MHWSLENMTLIEIDDMIDNLINQKSGSCHSDGIKLSATDVDRLITSYYNRIQIVLYLELILDKPTDDEVL